MTTAPHTNRRRRYPCAIFIMILLAATAGTRAEESPPYVAPDLETVVPHDNTQAITQAIARTRDTQRSADVEIVSGEDRVIYEYRVNGVVTAIKVVPRSGRPYYMVPTDGSPHYEINHDAKLYPKWILVEW